MSCDGSMLVWDPFMMNVVSEYECGPKVGVSNVRTKVAKLKLEFASASFNLIICRPHFVLQESYLILDIVWLRQHPRVTSD